MSAHRALCIFILSACASVSGLCGTALAASAPTLILTESPATVTKGDPATLYWSTTGATSCTSSGGWTGTRPTAGIAATSALSANTSFSLSCTGAGGTVTKSVSVAVTSTAAPTITLTESPASITAGESAMLYWKTSNATSCTSSGGWSGARPTAGSAATSTLSSSTGYTLTCSGAGGTVSKSVVVDVTAAAGSAGAGAGASCTGSNGALSLKASVTRTSGISPLLVFFDATASTDSNVTGKTTAFQDVTYTWNFGDGGASGTATWPYGSNKGHNLRNTATGGVAAHLYVTGSDTSYVATVTAHNGSNTASCQLGIEAYNPSGSNGFAGNKTTCVSSSGTPVAGSGDCPAGAVALKTSSFNTALSSTYFGSGKRVLFKCGDSFTGDNANLSGTKWSVGAYGGCENTTSNRPVLTDSGSAGELTVAVSSGDGRIADLDLQGAGKGAYAVETGGGNAIPYQITLYNLNSNGNNANYAWSQGAQWGLIESVMTAMRTSIGMYVNFSGNNPGQWTGNAYNNVNYQAVMGNFLNGNGGNGGTSGQEVMRVSACRLCVISNNTIENANSVGADLKIHNGNPSSPSTFSGVYTELLEISDNWFGGTSGSQAIENAPQNSSNDERLRNVVFERNIVSTGPAGQGGKLLVSAVNETVRNNVFYTASGVTPAPFYPIQVAQRADEPVPSGVEVYNNTCVRSTYCVGFDGEFYNAPPTNSVAENNLYYNTSNSYATVVNKGSGNTVSNNTATPASNPGFSDASGTYGYLSDFKPSANDTGAAAVPVWYDALGTANTSYVLGAVQ